MDFKIRNTDAHNPDCTITIRSLFVGLIQLFLAAFLFKPTACQAQNSVELAALYGASVFSDDHYTLKGNSYGIEAAFNIYQKHRTADWIKRLRIRDIAVAGAYRNMSNVYMADSADTKGFLGSIYTLSARLNVELLRLNKIEVLLVPGAGITYSSSSFFSNGNPLIGSHLNFSPQLGVRVRTPLSASTSLMAGADVVHYSNTGLQVPNRGVNITQLSIGIVHNVGKPVSDTTLENTDKVRGFVEAGADIGRRGVSRSRAGNWKSGVYLGYNYKLNSIISLKAGMDAVHYYTPYNNTDNTFQYLATSYGPWRVGISIGGDLHLGRFAVMSSYGYYLKFKGYYPIKYYWTVGFKYYANDWLGIQLKGYLHKMQTDYAGLGLVFRIPTHRFK